MNNFKMLPCATTSLSQSQFFGSGQLLKSEQVWNKCCMLVDKMEYKARQHLHAASDLDAGQAIYEPTNRE